jgi:hypothetical protein
MFRPRGAAHSGPAPLARDLEYQGFAPSLGTMPGNERFGQI